VKEGRCVVVVVVDDDDDDDDDDDIQVQRCVLGGLESVCEEEG